MSAAAKSEAARYRRRGWCPIPVKHRSKEPNLAELAPYLSGKATAEELRSWSWTGVGIVTGPPSGLLVLDVDNPEGEAVLKAHGHSVTPMVRTAGGGLHLYFRHPNAEVRTGIRVAPGIDVKASGGYVVAPPSVGPNGKPYEWIIGPDEAEPAEVPEWLMHLLEAPRRNGTAGPVGERIGSGRRNKELTSIGGTMRRRGLGEEEIFAALSVTNRTRCDPPLEEEEIRKIAASVARYEPAASAARDLYDGHDGRGGEKVEEKSGGEDGAKRAAPPTHDELRDRFTAEYGGYAFGLGEWRCYAEGCWTALPELTIKRYIAGVIEAAKPEGIKPTNSLLSSVTELTRVKVAVPDEEWDANPNVLVCKNGALRISSRTLRAHRPEDYATSAVPYNYDSKAVAVAWLAFLKGTVGKDAAEFLQEFAGYALTPEMIHELAVWLYGPPGSGKSTLLAGLQAMLGHRAGVLGLAEIERNRFALAGLPGKTLVAASEQPSSYLASTNTLNAIISGEPLQVERKYRDPVTVIPRCKIAWAMNELPRVADANSGLFRRVKVIRFPELPEKQRDPQVKKAIEREGAGILNWALGGLARLRERGSFEVPKGVQDATEHFRENNDVPALFVADRCVKEADASEKASTLYGEYRDWCEDNGHRPQSSTRLADDWQRLGFERYRSKGSTRYKGVRLRMAGDG